MLFKTLNKVFILNETIHKVVKFNIYQREDFTIPLCGSTGVYIEKYAMINL